MELKLSDGLIVDPEKFLMTVKLPHYHIKIKIVNTTSDKGLNVGLYDTSDKRIEYGEFRVSPLVISLVGKFFKF